MRSKNKLDKGILSKHLVCSNHIEHLVYNIPSLILFVLKLQQINYNGLDCNSFTQTVLNTSTQQEFSTIQITH